MAEWSEDHVVVIGSLKLNFGICWWNLVNWRPDRTLRWKAEDRWLGRAGSVMWKAGTSKVVAPVCVG
jgi:hypothetical protein